MRRVYCSIISLIILKVCCAQAVHQSIGLGTGTEIFYDNKIDPNDGGSVSVGFLVDPTGSNLNDLFIVKFDASHNIVWQKTISNSGDDNFNKVIVCANGDYVAVGQMYRSGIKRGIACRFSGNNGLLLWTSATSNSAHNEVYRDVFETSTGNIVLAGSLISVTAKSHIVLLNSSGDYITSTYSITPSANEFRNVSQLPNGNLIVVGYLNSGSSYYYAMIVELNPTTLAAVSQNRYTISTPIPGGLTVKSLWSTAIFVRNSTVLISFMAFPALVSTATQCMAIYTYNLTTRALTGNLYYQPGYSNAVAQSFYPLTQNDFLISQSFTSPATRAYASRVTNGVRVYDRKIDDKITTITNIDSYNGNISCSGTITGTFPTSNTNAYNLFSTVDIPLSASLCNISDINTLSLLVSNLSPLAAGLTYTVPEVPTKPVLVFQNSGYAVEIACGPPQTAYIFNGNGLWTDTNNWLNNLIPPAILPKDFTININPVIGGSCTLNAWQTISEGAHLVIAGGTNFIVQGSINIQATEVAICNQVWSMKNLDVATYRNGDPIPKVSDAATWNTLTTGAYCYYNNDSATYAAVYGKLYNWYAVADPRGLAPVGWHIPTHAEWGPLSSCLGGAAIAGGFLKESGTAHWNSPNTGATNSTGFTAVPAGRRLETGEYDNLGFMCTFWDTTVGVPGEAFGAMLFSTDPNLFATGNVFARGFSVRCIKD